MGAWTGSYAAIDDFILDGREDDGTKWGITDFDWGGTSEPSLEVIRRTRISGGRGGDSFGGPRTIPVSGWVTTPTEDMLSHAMDRLNAAVSRQPVRFDVVESGRARWAMVQRSDSVLFQRRGRRYATWSIQVKSKDWRKFGEPVVGSTHLPASTGGLVIPFTVPFTIDAVTVSGQVSLTNDGNEVGPVALRIDGPCTGPVITHRGTGESLVFSSSLVLLAGEWLEIDMERHTALANGQASRAGYITSRGWSSFEPGVNTWSFTASAFHADSLLTVTATPADE